MFAGDSPAAAEAFAAVDPYVTDGLVASWTVRQWNEVLEDGVTADPYDARRDDRSVAPGCPAGAH